MKGSVEINWGNKIKSIRGPGFDQGSLRVQLGDHASLGESWGQKTKEHLYGVEEKA
jgi:hypothetical protein